MIYTQTVRNSHSQLTSFTNISPIRVKTAEHEALRVTLHSPLELTLGQVFRREDSAARAAIVAQRHACNFRRKPFKDSDFDFTDPEKSSAAAADALLSRKELRSRQFVKFT